MAPEQADALARVLPHGLLEPARDFTGMGIALREPGARAPAGAPLPRRARRRNPLRPTGGRAPRARAVERARAGAALAAELALLGHRSGQLRGLMRHLAASPHRRRVLVGDLNATPIWPLYRRLAARLSDAAVVAARRHGRRVQRTWGPWPGAPRLLRIDHALVHGVGVEDFQVVPIPGGDHSAIVVDVAVPIAMLTAAGGTTASPRRAMPLGAATAPARRAAAASAA